MFFFIGDWNFKSDVKLQFPYTWPLFLFRNPSLLRWSSFAFSPHILLPIAPFFFTSIFNTRCFVCENIVHAYTEQQVWQQWDLEYVFLFVSDSFTLFSKELVKLHRNLMQDIHDSIVNKNDQNLYQVFINYKER